MQKNSNQKENSIENLSEILKIRREKFNVLCESKQNPFEITKFLRSNFSDEIKNNFENFEKKTVGVAGRIMNWRAMGKALFLDVEDTAGRIQIYVKSNDIGEEAYKNFRLWDIGDIIGINGFVFKTRRGEISIHAENIILLAKSLLPLPEKFHGLKDTDARYRQKYLDLTMNADVKKIFLTRSKIIKKIREYLDNLGFLEVETPMLNNIPGGAAAKPFVTHHNALNLDLFLRVSPELYLKRLIVGGMDKVYEIDRVFRNEGMSVKHNPEFTILELYEAFSDYNDMMKTCEEIIKNCAKILHDEQIFEYQGDKIDLNKPFERLSMIEAVKKYTDEDFSAFIENDEKANEIAAKLGITISSNNSWGNILNAVFEGKVEKNLIQPTFIYDYPVEISPLTKRKKDIPELVERFELFIAGRELANAYSELNDPIDQRNRFKHQMELRNSGDEEANLIDEDYITALEYGMPPTGGLGIGIDRLVMLLTNNASIREVILFPTMKPI